MKRIIFVIFSMLLITSVSAMDETAEKTMVCSACHGPQGISSNPAWPNLAGQHAAYLLKQSKDFKAHDQRLSPVMMPFVSQLSEQDMQSLADFYAKQTPPKIATTTADLSRGAQLYRQGDIKKHITACIACHGPQGTGNPNAGFPVLAGQQEDYTIAQLYAFKNKSRQNDVNDIMRMITARMDQEDITAVAKYLAHFPQGKDK